MLEREGEIGELDPVFRPATVISTMGTPRTFSIIRPRDAQYRLLFSTAPCIRVGWMLTMSSILHCDEAGNVQPWHSRGCQGRARPTWLTSDSLIHDLQF